MFMSLNIQKWMLRESGWNRNTTHITEQAVKASYYTNAALWYLQMQRYGPLIKGGLAKGNVNFGSTTSQICF